MFKLDIFRREEKAAVEHVPFMEPTGIRFSKIGSSRRGQPLRNIKVTSCVHAFRISMRIATSFVLVACTTYRPLGCIG